MTEIVDKELRRFGVTLSKPILAAVAILFGFLVIIFPNFLAWIVGLFFIVQGILLLMDYYELRRR